MPLPNWISTRPAAVVMSENWLATSPVYSGSAYQMPVVVFSHSTVPTSTRTRSLDDRNPEPT